jgi:NTP pyrophosphatase (non-canonical NTP hydrolase)
MNFEEYQKQALETRKDPAFKGEKRTIPFLGLAGETGELLSAYKKHLRDGPSHTLHKARVEEELGDLLWYLSDVASYHEISLDDIARNNIVKCVDRFGRPIHISNLDDDYPEHERFPRSLQTKFVQETNGRVCIYVNDQRIGDELTDNSYDDDGYRYHDVFHLACMAILGWSPVMRKLLNVKRKSRPQTDEVQDGARAKITEEAISAIVYAYARTHSMLDGIATLDSYLLRVIKDVTSELEVSVRSSSEWEQTILNAYEVWRALRQDGGGTVFADLDTRHISLAG